MSRTARRSLPLPPPPPRRGARTLLYPVALTAALVAACTPRGPAAPSSSIAGSTAPAPPLAAVPRPHVIAWAARDRDRPLAPPGVHHLQVVVTRGWTAGEHYVWLVGDGRELAAVFRASDRDLVELIGEITHRYYPTVGNPLSDVGYSIVGSFKPPPPPPPPDPGGVPDDVVRQVMEAAAAVHGAGARLDAGLATAHP